MITVKFINNDVIILKYMIYTFEMIPIYKPYLKNYKQSALKSIQDEWISNQVICHFMVGCYRSPDGSTLILGINGN